MVFTGWMPQHVTEAEMLEKKYCHVENRMQQLSKRFFLLLYVKFIERSLGPFYGAIAVPSVTHCRCCGHRYAGGVRVVA